MEKEKLPEVIPANDIQIVEPSPMAMAQAFLTAGGDLDTLKEMMSLQREHDAYQAKKAYHKAMAAFKKNPPVIGKDKHVAYKTTRYSHASLGNVTKQINMALGEHGLSAAWPLEQSNNGIKVTCVITHEMGHSESTSLTAGADSTGTKNGIQAMGSTISYLQRYTILALTGLATEDQDDDGAGAGDQQLPPRQIIIGPANVNWLIGFFKRHGLLDEKAKKKFQEHYGFTAYTTNSEEFASIKAKIEADYNEVG